MAKENYYEGIKHIVRITTDYSDNCEHCKQHFMESASAINHYIKEHGYKILYIGHENDYSGSDIYHYTVTILGK
jgi:hypothetical protein